MARGRLRRGWLAARHPLMLPVWAALGVWSWRTLLEQREVGAVTLKSVGDLADGVLASDRRVPQTTVWTYDDLYAVSEGKRWRILDVNLESADEFSRLWQHEPDRLVQVEVSLSEELSGALAHTRRELHDEVKAIPFSNRTLSAEELGAIRRAAVDHLLRDNPQLVGEAARMGRIAHARGADVRSASTVWSGFGVNAGVLVGSVMSVLTMARAVGMVPGVVGRMREARRRRRGLCGACAYPLGGVTGEVCPECGTSIAPAR